MVRHRATVNQPLVPNQGSLRLLASSSVVGCFVLDRRGRIIEPNSVFRRWLGIKDAEGEVAESLFAYLPHTEDENAVRQALETAGGTRIPLRLERPDGTPVTVVGDFVPIEAGSEGPVLAGLFREALTDLSMRAGMERGARLEALGSLTSGVAHDFNNLLTILIGNLSLAADELADQPESLAKVQTAREAARHGAELIEQLLAFARQEPVDSEPISPAQVIGGVAPLIERALGGRIRLELDLEEGAPPVLGNSAQLESVIVNLAINARDAIADRGLVRISASSRSVTTSDADRIGLVPGSYLSVEVSDDGAGIPDNVIDRVFEPFFTTKTNGKGSGLGLSMVKQYTDQFGGTTGLVSKLGKGTTVRLQFPTAERTEDQPPVNARPVAALPGGDESVLVVADDERLRAMLNQILNVLGYRCQVAATADAVPQLARECLPDLIVVDGIGVFRSLLESDMFAEQGVRPLLLETMGEAEGDLSVAILHKPFSIPDLAATVRATLDSDD